MYRSPTQRPFTGRLHRFALLLLVIALAACEQIEQSVFSGDLNTLLSRGAGFANSLIATPAERLTDEEIIALGYLERARLGLGSPFRLVDFVLDDPDLPETTREAVAYAILAHTWQGRIYEVEPRVLDLVVLAGPGGRRSGLQQMQLIERQIATAPSATAGERAVRLGYRLAEAERSVTGVPHSVVAHVAALISDRRRAREDVVLLVRTATRVGRDPLELLQEWRRDLRFTVESPALAPVSVLQEEAEANDGPQFALSLRTLAQRRSGPRTGRGGPGAATTEERTYFGEGVAVRLHELALERGYPPQAPIAVALSINRDALVSGTGLEPWQRDARRHFAGTAWNEERLVSAAQILSDQGAAQGVRLALIQLQAATFLRVWNQEEPWFPGSPTSTARELEARYGITAIEFDDEIPAAWRAYSLRMLGQGITDLQRVLPTASVRGLRIRFASLPHDLRALALHEPRSRTLVLPPLTGAGTLAHEIAHDLDWQLARTRYNARGTYATDFAVRQQRGDRVATSIQGLSAALVRPLPPDSVPSPHDTRPAEVFARGTDWFVAAVLASEGRTGGYLTSFQDAALTGYGTTRGPDVRGGAVPAILALLDGVAPVVERTRIWAMDAHGPARTLSPTELAGAILDAGRDRPLAERLPMVVAARDRSLASVDAVSCRLSSAEGMRRLAGAQRQLVEFATRSAARGAAIDAVHQLGNDQLGPNREALVGEWVSWYLYGAPAPVDSALAEIAPAFHDVFVRADLMTRQESQPISGIAALGRPPIICGGNPFAASALGRPAW